jgi:hypothetical protein
MMRQINRARIELKEQGKAPEIKIPESFLQLGGYKAIIGEKVKEARAELKHDIEYAILHDEPLRIVSVRDTGSSQVNYRMVINSLAQGNTQPAIKALTDAPTNIYRDEAMIICESARNNLMRKGEALPAGYHELKAAVEAYEGDEYTHPQTPPWGITERHEKIIKDAYELWAKPKEEAHKVHDKKKKRGKGRLLQEGTPSPRTILGDLSFSQNKPYTSGVDRIPSLDDVLARYDSLTPTAREMAVTRMGLVLGSGLPEEVKRDSTRRIFEHTVADNPFLFVLDRMAMDEAGFIASLPAQCSIFRGSQNRQMHEDNMHRLHALAEKVDDESERNRFYRNFLYANAGKTTREAGSAIDNLEEYGTTDEAVSSAYHSVALASTDEVIKAMDFLPSAQQSTLLRDKNDFLLREAKVGGDLRMVQGLYDICTHILPRVYMATPSEQHIAHETIKAVCEGRGLQPFIGDALEVANMHDMLHLELRNAFENQEIGAAEKLEAMKGMVGKAQDAVRGAEASKAAVEPQTYLDGFPKTSSIYSTHSEEIKRMGALFAGAEDILRDTTDAEAALMYIKAAYPRPVSVSLEFNGEPLISDSKFDDVEKATRQGIVGLWKTHSQKLKNLGGLYKWTDFSRKQYIGEQVSQLLLRDEETFRATVDCGLLDHDTGHSGFGHDGAQNPIPKEAAAQGVTVGWSKARIMAYWSCRDALEGRRWNTAKVFGRMFHLPAQELAECSKHIEELEGRGFDEERMTSVLAKVESGGRTLPQAMKEAYDEIVDGARRAWFVQQGLLDPETVGRLNVRHGLFEGSVDVRNFLARTIQVDADDQNRILKAAADCEDTDRATALVVSGVIPTRLSQTTKPMREDALTQVLERTAQTPADRFEQEADAIFLELAEERARGDALAQAGLETQLVSQAAQRHGLFANAADVNAFGERTRNLTPEERNELLRLGLARTTGAAQWIQSTTLTAQLATFPPNQGITTLRDIAQRTANAPQANLDEAIAAAAEDIRYENALTTTQLDQAGWGALAQRHPTLKRHNTVQEASTSLTPLDTNNKQQLIAAACQSNDPQTAYTIITDRQIIHQVAQMNQTPDTQTMLIDAIAQNAATTGHDQIRQQTKQAAQQLATRAQTEQAIHWPPEFARREYLDRIMAAELPPEILPEIDPKTIQPEQLTAFLKQNTHIKQGLQTQVTLIGQGAQNA